MNAILRIYATGLGAGFFPIAPGTAGSLLGLALYAATPLPLGQTGELSWIVFAFLVVTTLIGIPAATRAEDEFGHDGGPIVIDEVVGQWITVAGLAPSPVVLIGGFLLFRLFDILKPFPAEQSQHWGKGLGVMIDDVIAGIYAAIVLRLILHFGGLA